MIGRLKRVGLAVIVATTAIPCAANADVGEVKFARQFGIHYLPLVIMEREKLVEQKAKEAGLDTLKVQWTQISGGASMNDALLSGVINFAAGGVGPMIQIWDKSRGNMDVRGVAAVSDVPMTLVTRNSNIKKLEDLADSDRIALPAVKTSMQAVTLQMAAAKIWGDAQYEKLDKLTVSMSHPDGMATLLSGRSEITAHFTAAPYDFLELKRPNIHRVIDSYEIYGGPATLIVLYTIKKFHDQNPKVYTAVINALEAATVLIARDKRRAAEIYLEVTKEKVALDDMLGMLNDPRINFTLTPSNSFPVAQFMQRTKRTKNLPASWKDLYFPAIHDRSGS